MSKEVAFEYMRACMVTDLRMRVRDARVASFVSRLEALSWLTKFFREHPQSIADWRQRKKGDAATNELVGCPAGFSRRC